MYDVFISHAFEDQESFVRPLAVSLKRLGVNVWYAEFSLRPGDSLSQSIDKGLALSKFGLVVISQFFMQKPWPKRELSGLVAREIEEGRVIVPIWHGVTKQDVLSFSPPLADKVALRTEGSSAQDIAIQILREIRPDLYKDHPRAELERLASGEAIGELQHEIDSIAEELENTKEELAEYKCEYCSSPLISRIQAPADPEEKYWDLREVYECGHMTYGGSLERPCPSDPRFPKFSDYELHFYDLPEEPNWKWECLAVGSTDMAQTVDLGSGYGQTREEAEKEVRNSYERRAKKWKG